MGVRSKIGAASCALVVTICACGGGDERLTAAEYARAASGVCAQANRGVLSVATSETSLDGGFGRVLRRAVALHRRSIDDLRNLRPPERLAGTVQRWIALLDQGVDELELMSEHLRQGRVADAAAYGDKAASLLDRAEELVTPLRITSCRVPELPVA
jgi:hypothetical protein